MERKQLMQAVADKAFERRIRLSTSCEKAGVSRTVAYRFINGSYLPLLETIGKLEAALDKIEADQ